MKILLIEDNELVLSFLQKALKLKGHQVFKAATKAQGLALAQLENCEIVLTDYDLPDGNGLDLIKALSGTHKLAQPPTRYILMSGREEAYLLSLLAELKLPGVVTKVLTKPFSLLELNSLLEELKQIEKLSNLSLVTTPKTKNKICYRTENKFLRKR
jgi:DNA-binding response OmpR family regulator